MRELFSQAAPACAIVVALAACAGAAPEVAEPGKLSSGPVREQITAESTAIDDRIEVRLYAGRPCPVISTGEFCGRWPAGAGISVRLVFFDASELRTTSDARGVASIKLETAIASTSLQAGKADVVVRDMRVGQVDLTGLSQWASWRTAVDADRVAKEHQAAIDADERDFRTAAGACRAATRLEDCVPLMRLSERYDSESERMQNLIAALRVGLPRGLDDAQNKFSKGCSLSPVWCITTADSFIELLETPAARICVSDVDQRLAFVRRIAMEAKKTPASAIPSAATQPAPLFAWSSTTPTTPTAPSQREAEERHQREIREMQFRYDEEMRQREREQRDAQARMHDARRRSEEERQRRDSEEQQRRSRAAFGCYTACSQARNSCVIGYGPDYNKTCLSQLEASHNACCTGAGMRSAWPTCGCSER